jgi:hypothetical protein
VDQNADAQATKEFFDAWDTAIKTKDKPFESGSTHSVIANTIKRELGMLPQNQDTK